MDPFVESRVIVVNGGYTEVALQLTCEKSILGNSVYVKHKQQPETCDDLFKNNKFIFVQIVV